MARPVGEEDNNEIPKAISRPEGGWFAKIWDERKTGERKMIKLDRSEPFTVWVDLIKLGKSLSTISDQKIECVEKTELIKLPQSKAFSIWCMEQKLIADSEELIESIPEEAFSGVLNQENRKSEFIYNPFTIWTTGEFVLDTKILKIQLKSDNKKDGEPANEIGGSKSEITSLEKENINELKSSSFPVYAVLSSVVLVAFIIWMFVKASQLSDVKVQRANLEETLVLKEKEINEKDNKIAKADQDNLKLTSTLSDERLKAKAAALNAQEVKRLELKKVNDRFQEKVTEIKKMAEQMQLNQENFDNQKSALSKQADDLMVLISKLKLDNTKSNELLKKSEEQIEGSNKKITSLSKEISGLKVALNDSQELMKSLQKMHEEKVKKMESEKFQIQELLEKELADKQKITNNLETSKSQLKELTIEVEGLKKRIIELQEDQSPNQ
tara:strand:+ start:384 stop:1706 length:1323 start_codon:yes stop_codon:yes gene_type:complete